MKTIFVADDDDGFRTVVVRTLRRLGYGVTEVGEGAAALEALAAAADGLAPMPDLVLLDVCMPGYSGLGILRSMRRFQKRPPTVLMTAFPDVSIDAIAAAYGAETTLHKPVELEELLDVVRTLVGSP